jgi:hypothetical protein
MLTAAAARTSTQRACQLATTQQARGSATHRDATKLVITARKSSADSQQRSTKPRSETYQRATTCRPIARCHGIRTVRGDGQRQSKPGGPECTRRSVTVWKDPSNLQSSATQQVATKRDASIMSAAADSNIFSFHNEHPNKRRAQPEATKRDPSSSQNALVMALPAIKSPLFERHSRKAPAANNPRNNVARQRQCEP